MSSSPIAQAKEFLASQPPIRLAAGTVLLLLAAQVFAQWLAAKKKLRDLKGKPAWLVPSWAPFGLDLAVKGVWHLKTDGYFDYTRDLLRKTGDRRTIEFHMVGKRMIITDNPENVQGMLVQQFDDYGKGRLTHRIFQSLFKGSIFGSDHADWAAHRKALRPHVGKVRDTDDKVLEKHFQEMLNKFPEPNTPVEIYDIIDRALLNAVTEIFVDPEIPTDLPTEPFIAGVNGLLKFNTFRVLLGRISLLLPDKWVLKNSTNTLYSFLDNHVARIHKIQETVDVKNKPEKEWTLMERFAADGVPARDYRSRFVSLLSASKDPVGMIIVWILYEAARNPEIQRKLREEIHEVVGSEQEFPTQDQLANMPYLQNTIKEAMRMYHPFGFNVRCADKDTTMPTGGGPDGKDPIPVLEGTMIVMNILGLQRREDFWGEDTDTFRPERFDEFKPGPFEYLPFNRGPRNCLGQKFGELAMQYLLVRFYQLFDIERADDIVQKIKVEMNTKVSDPVNLLFKPRHGATAQEEVARNPAPLVPVAAA